MGRKKKKNIPQIDEQELYRAFGIEEEPQVFSVELEGNLAEQDLHRIIEEKAASFRDPESRQDRLRNYPPPQDQLDLHGLTGPEAEKKTIDFIRTANTLERQTVRIITGKGLHSEGPAVLPGIIETRLKELKSADLIFDFRWEKKDRHKSGSVIVFLQ